MRRLTLVAVLVLVLITAACGSGAPTPEPQASSSSDTELVRFVKRLLTYYGYPFEGEPAILPGEVPSDMAAEIPIPDDAEVIGSLVRSDKYTQVQVILDVPREPAEVLKFYRQALAEAGWKEWEQPQYWAGFVPMRLPASATFCWQEEKVPSLSVSAYVSEGEGPADVRLHWNDNPEMSPCREREVPGPWPGPDLLPGLEAPQGAVQRGGGSGGGGDYRDSSATLETELDAGELEAHYRRQLLEAGWKLEEQGSGAAIAWSTWSLADKFGDAWSGLLLVREAGQGKFVAYLRADIVP